jgi:hypothetical protein
MLCFQCICAVVTWTIEMMSLRLSIRLEYQLCIQLEFLLCQYSNFLLDFCAQTLALMPRHSSVA